MPVATQLPPPIPSRRLGSAVQRSTPVGYRRSASTTLDLPSAAAASSRSFRPTIKRSQSFGIDSSHLLGDGLYYERSYQLQQQQQQQQQQRKQDQRHQLVQQGMVEEKEGRRSPVMPPLNTDSAKSGRVSDQDDDGVISNEKERDQTYSAETIALRRFMTMVAWGPGLSVVKHNRGRGRVRRVLKFNDEEGYLYWCSTFPPFHKTRVSTKMLLKASRVGNLVTVMITDQGDVAFECARLTDAIVLDVGLNGVIRVCNNNGGGSRSSSSRSTPTSSSISPTERER